MEIQHQGGRANFINDRLPQNTVCLEPDFSSPVIFLRPDDILTVIWGYWNGEDCDLISYFVPQHINLLRLIPVVNMHRVNKLNKKLSVCFQAALQHHQHLLSTEFERKTEKIRDIKKE